MDRGYAGFFSLVEAKQTLHDLQRGIRVSFSKGSFLRVSFDAKSIRLAVSRNESRSHRGKERGYGAKRTLTAILDSEPPASAYSPPESR